MTKLCFWKPHKTTWGPELESGTYQGKGMCPGNCLPSGTPKSENDRTKTTHKETAAQLPEALVSEFGLR